MARFAKIDGAPALKDREATEEIDRFCRERLASECAVERLAGDASTRVYYRLRPASGAVPLVLMDTGRPIDPSEDPFLKADELFSRLGLPVPRIVQVFPEEGRILLEDLGDVLLQFEVDRSSEEERERLYGRALEHLVLLHTDGTLALFNAPAHPAARQALDRERFLFELEFMLEHYGRALRRAALSEPQLAVLREWFEWLSAEAASFGRVLCHRDYHSRNLMLHGDELALLDFQDARWGPVTYDVASLLRDSYVSLAEPFVERMLEQFRGLLLGRLQSVAERDGEPLGGLAPLLNDPLEWRRRFDLTCLQRNLKALGTFGYQTIVRGNDVYLRYIAPTSRHVRRNLLRFPEFASVLEVFDRSGILPAEAEAGI